MTETIELSIDSKLEFVDLVASVTKSVTAKMGFTEDDASWIELAVHEAVINAITHGNKSADDMLNPSGRGIFYMRTFMDEVEHSIHPEGGSVVRMKKLKQHS